jgi:hypothetical protein
MNIKKIYISLFAMLFALLTLSPLSFAIDENEVTKEEFSTINELVNTENLDLRKNKIESEIKNKRSKKFNDILLNKISVRETSEKLPIIKSLNNKYSLKTNNYGCYEDAYSRSQYSYLGVLLFKFNLRVNACVDFARVYSGIVRSSWGEINTFGWSYYGETNDRKFDYINYQKTEYIASRQGLFKLCINNNWGCAQEIRPWIEIRSTREGYNNIYSVG